MDVPADQTVQALHRAFETWGLPGRIRVDNGDPWISPTGDLPTELGLWLSGLGIDLVPNRVRQPEDNAVVECSQRTGQRWADPPRCRSAAELQRQLDTMDRHQREGFPDAAHSRMRLFPGLAHSGRAYHRAMEASLWRLGRVREKLAGSAVVRSSNAQGPGLGLRAELSGGTEVRGRIGLCAAGCRERGLVDRAARRPVDRSPSGRAESGGDPGPSGDPPSSWPGSERRRGPG